MNTKPLDNPLLKRPPAHANQCGADTPETRDWMGSNSK